MAGKEVTNAFGLSKLCNLENPAGGMPVKVHEKENKKRLNITRNVRHIVVVFIFQE